MRAADLRERTRLTRRVLDVFLIITSLKMLTHKYSILIFLVALAAYNQVVKGQSRLTQSTPAEISSVKIDEYGNLSSLYLP